MQSAMNCFALVCTRILLTIPPCARLMGVVRGLQTRRNAHDPRSRGTCSWQPFSCIKCCLWPTIRCEGSAHSEAHFKDEVSGFHNPLGEVGWGSCLNGGDYEAFSKYVLDTKGPGLVDNCRSFLEKDIAVKKAEVLAKYNVETYNRLPSEVQIELAAKDREFKGKSGECPASAAAFRPRGLDTEGDWSPKKNINKWKVHHHLKIACEIPSHFTVR